MCINPSIGLVNHCVEQNEQGDAAYLRSIQVGVPNLRVVIYNVLHLTRRTFLLKLGMKEISIAQNPLPMCHSDT